MPITVCIVDDEPLAIHEMKSLLSQYKDISICATAKSANEAITVINTFKPDLVFLDIQLKEINAFSILESLTVKTHLVFVTAYNEFATRAFEINALDYLLKPVIPSRLEDTINRFKSNIKPLKPKITTYKHTDRIVINEKNEYRLIIISDILAITADGDYTNIYLLDGTKKLLLKSMAQWEALLPSHYFERIHRGTIINLEYIDSIEKGFNNTCKIYIKTLDLPFQMSQRYTAKFLSKYKA